jgi:hypothetical protein
MSPIKLCVEPRCDRPATSKGRCDLHRRERERKRSRKRRGGLYGLGYNDTIAARDADPDYRYPRRQTPPDAA